MVLSEQTKRLLIYFFFDKDGIVDDYITYLLSDMKKNVSEILFVSNGAIEDKSKAKLESLADQILERPNIDLDVGAYKQALETIGFDNLKNYDEVILMNYTIMGPVYPFKEMFDDMDKRDLDFWGLTLYHRTENVDKAVFPEGFIREHLQSHFIAVRKPMLSSPKFREYWEKLPKMKAYYDSVTQHESRFTEYFEKLGYKWAPYVDTRDMVDYTNCPIIFIPTQIISEKRCPVFKRRSFFHDYNDILYNTVGEVSYELFDYIKNHTDYDVNMIYDNILRCYDLSDIKDCMQWNYVLPKNASIKDNDLTNEKVALVFHAYFKDLIESTYKYVNSMPEYADVYITTDTKEKKELLEERFKNNKFNKFEVLLIKNRGRDVSALLVATKDFIMNYDYVCFAHDKKVTQIPRLSVGAGFAYQCLENVLASETYVKNVINTFKENERLGVLFPPPPFHAEYAPSVANGWGTGNFEATVSLAKQLNMTVPISGKKRCIAPLGTMFWFRPKSMKVLFDHDWKYNEFPQEPNKFDGTLLHAVERIYCYAAQQLGYYSAWGICDNFASMLITNYNYMLSDFYQIALESKNAGTHFIVKKQFNDKIKAFNSVSDAKRFVTRAFSHKDGLVTKCTKLYYDKGDGFNEDDRLVKYNESGEGRFEHTFEFKKPLNIKAIRFDPDEYQNVVVDRFVATLIYEDGSTVVKQTKDFVNNGATYFDTLVFENEDPAMWCEVGKNLKLKAVKVSAYITYGITTDLILNISNRASLAQLENTMELLAKKFNIKIANKKDTIIRRALRKIKRLLRR